MLFVHANVVVVIVAVEFPNLVFFFQLWSFFYVLFVISFMRCDPSYALQLLILWDRSIFSVCVSPSLFRSCISFYLIAQTEIHRIESIFKQFMHYQALNSYRHIFT